MRPAEYAVVRVIADPGRDEPMNVGLILWNAQAIRMRVDPEALDAVTKRHPHLTSDALLFVEDYLRDGLGSVDPSDSAFVAQTLTALSRFPVSITEPRFVSLVEDIPQALDDAIENAMERIVHPPRRQGGGRPTARHHLRRLLQPLIGRRLVAENHAFVGRSGNTRRVNFFAVCENAIAVDTVSLAVRDADEIIRRSDAMAFKVHDIVGEHNVQVAVYGEFPEDETFRAASGAARRSIESAGAELVPSLEHAVDRLWEAVSLKFPGGSEDAGESRRVGLGRSA